MPRKPAFNGIEIIGKPSIANFCNTLAFIYSQRTGTETTITSIRDRRTGEEIYRKP